MYTLVCDGTAEASYRFIQINFNLVRAWLLAKLEAIRVRAMRYVSSAAYRNATTRKGSDVNQTRIAVKRDFKRDEVGDGALEIKLRLQSCVNEFTAILSILS